MKHQSRNAEQPYRAAMSEFAVLGGCVGLTHAVAESVVQALWGVPLMPLDWVIGMVLCGLVGLAGGAFVWVLGLGLRRARRRHPLWQTEVARRRLLWTGMVVLHTALAWSIVCQRAVGVGLVATLGISAVVVTILLVLGYRRADSLGCLLIASLGLTCANVGATTIPTVISVLPTAASVLAAALALLCLPTACMISISLAKSTLPPGTSPPRAAVAGLACVVLVSGLLSMTVFPLELGWHVLEEPVTDWPGKADAPNILLIVLDTVRADHLDFFGYPRQTMPALTRFARESCQVSQAILSTAASTLPAHGSMFTGHHSHTHGGHLLFLGDDQRGTDYGYPMRDDLPTLAEHLSGLGFQTAGIAANFAILSSYGLGRGFGHYDVVQGPGFWGPQLTWLYAGPTRKDSFGKFLSDHLPEPLGRRTQLFNRCEPPYCRAEAITDRALAWLGDRGDRPFFLFLNYLDAHRPYVPLPQYERRFTPEGSEIRWVGFLPGELSEPFMRGETSGPPPWREHLVGLYDAELAYLDDQLARLLDELRQRTWWDNTLVMIVSDHGEAFTEHGLLEHGTSVYDTQVRVPLFIKFPTWMADAPPQVPPWFQFVDIYPSIMDMLDEEVPADIAGSPWGGQRGTALTQGFVSRYDVPWLDRELCAVILGPHKYILSTTGEAELYNVAQDPGETRNLIGTRPEVEARARALIDRRNAEMVRQLSPSPEDAALHRNLRSLGYMQ